MAEQRLISLVRGGKVEAFFSGIARNRPREPTTPSYPGRPPGSAGEAVEV